MASLYVYSAHYAAKHIKLIVKVKTISGQNGLPKRKLPPKPAWLKCKPSFRVFRVVRGEGKPRNTPTTRTKLHGADDWPPRVMPL